MGKNYFENN